MIDIHCHILPNTDDGPKDEEEFLKMAQAAVHAEITQLFATPHHYHERYDNVKYEILEKVSKCNRLLELANIPLAIHPGQELRIHSQILQSIEQDEVLTYDNRGKYLLLELPAAVIPEYSYEMVYELRVRGIIPIIAHPERNRCFLEEPALLFELIEEGALMQITAGSILGHFGRKVKSFTQKLIEHQLTHFIATDAHNTVSRGFFLREAYHTIQSIYGEEVTEYYENNTERLLMNKDIFMKEPIPIRKKMFGLF